MLDTILTAIITALERAGISAFKAFDETAARLKGGACVSVGIDKCKYLSSGFAEYLGIRASGDGSADTELFGRRLELELGLEIYSPFGEGLGVQSCVQTADSVRACIDSLAPGIKTLEMCFGEAEPDEKLRAFRCPGKLRCFAFLTAEGAREEPEFLDFVLKGTVDCGNK